MNAPTDLKVTKRDGRLENLDLDKIHRVVTWAAEGLKNVSVSQVELKSHIQFYNGIRTDDIHETIIKAAADLISQDTPDYQYLAARLAIFHLRKIAYGEFEPPHLFDHVKKLTDTGKYDRHIIEDYSREEFDELNAYIDHSRDMTFSYAAVKQLEGKYLVQNRVTRQIYETPQFLYILVAMCLFSKYPKETRLDYVKRFYDAVSTFKVSLPTPIMSGVRTPTRQFSSCVLIECDDSLDSINATTSAIVKYVSQRAGIGINAGRIRGLGSEIRGGEAQHTGCIPFFKMFQAAVKSCSQGGVRGGAATLFYPLWHIEAESLLVLKNNRGVEDNRIRQLDYGVQINRLLYTRLIKGGNITLFSPNEVPGLYDAFFADQDEFERLYTKYEQDPNIRKRTLSAFNLGALNSLDELEGLADLTVRALDALLDYQDYPVEAARTATMNRRTLGIGVINYAYYLAKNGVRYSDDSALGLTHRTFEAMQYYLLKASVNLAKEYGACPLFNQTVYSQGKLPIDTYKKDLDAVCSEPLLCDWESLRADIVKYGLRNSTLTALMPSETSSQIANATNGIEPPRGLVTVKASKDGILKQVVPEFETLKDAYETLWQLPGNEGYLKLVGVMQKFVDQAISANTAYDPGKFEGNKVSMKQMLKDLLTAYKYGVKTLYYHNTRDGADDTQTDIQDDGCAGGACKI